ncbi:ABC transporter ATP-binding protein, partial [Candidatus Micrarchaeota archaeon]|nr:ABC transporter ATP-binding protein [Candidatus Micrarchaeota archaeon]
ATIIPIVIIQKYYGRLIRKKYKSIRVSAADFLSFLQEKLSMIMLTKVFTREDYELTREKAKAKSLIKKELELTMTQSIMTATIAVITFAVMLFILWYGGVKVIAGAMTIGTLIAIYTYILQMFGPLETLVDINVSLQTTMVSVNRVFSFLDKKSEVIEKADAVELKNARGSIEFDNVFFTYGGRGRCIENVSLKIKPGERVAIVGPTGAGKTTLGSLITRLYDPQDGSVKIDGKDVRDLKIKSLRKNIGVVSQNTALFHTSIRENIAYGKPRSSKHEIIEAAKIAGIHDFIEKLPRGYETSVGERGAELSGGEAQRLAIARAALKNPAIIILDEATSSLDLETERRIQENLEKLTAGKTTIIITHRLTSVKNADRIVFMERGAIAEVGTFNALMKKKGRFYRMYETQNK